MIHFVAKRILECSIKTIDDKNHIRFYSLKDVDVDSIKFLADKPKEKKVMSPPKQVTKTFGKKIKKIINKN